MWYNPIMEWILKSPLHGVLSSSMMIINYSGRKSGKAYHTPAGYREIDHTLLTISYKNRTWWRNLRGGAEVKIFLKGKLLEATSQAFEDDQAVINGLEQFIAGDPRAARMFKIEMGEDGQLDPESLKRAGRDKVIISTTLK